MKIWYPRNWSEAIAVTGAGSALVVFDRAMAPYEAAVQAGYLKMASLAAAVACGCALWSHMRGLSLERRGFYPRVLPVIAAAIAGLTFIHTMHYVFFLAGLPINADVSEPAARIALSDWWVIALGTASVGGAYTVFRTQLAQQSPR